MAEKTLPRYKHFTLDPTHPIGDDVEDERNTNTLSETPPSAAFSSEEAEQLKELSDAERDAFREREDERRKAERKRAESDERPKPSELLAEREGRKTKGKAK